MNLDQIKYLLAIAEYGSLTAAARHLSVSQQALSKYLSGLEQAVGCPLFERHKRQLRPTAAGARYLKSAGEISSIMERAVRIIAGLEHPQKATLNIGVSSFSGSSLLARCLPDFISRFPYVQVVPKEGFTPSLLDMAEKGEIDLAFVSIGEPIPAGIKRLKLGKDIIVLAVNPMHPLAHDIKAYDQLPKIDIQELRDEVFVQTDEKTALYKILKRAFDEAGFEPTVVYSSSNLILQKELIKAGYGIGFLRYDPDTELSQYRVDIALDGDISIIMKESHVLHEAERYLIYLLNKYWYLSYMTQEPSPEILDIMNEFSEADH